MALQLSLRRGLTSCVTSQALRASTVSPAGSFLAKRWQSTGADVGDVIGIDLGTTNSCVAVMVGLLLLFPSHELAVCMKLLPQQHVGR